MNPKSVLNIGLSILAVSACSPGNQRDKGFHGQPNIIFILADDLGYGDLSCYGQRNFQTKCLDNLASEGMRFTQHYAGTTVSAPSRCSLMTGMHTGHSFIRGNKATPPMGQYPIKDSIITIAEILKQAGYYTGLIGKWGLGGPDTEGIPNRQGFDYFFGYLCQSHAHNYYPEFLFRNTERVYLSNVLPEPKDCGGKGVSVVKKEYSHDIFVNEALEFITLHKDTSFFLYFAVTIPHANNEAKEMGMEVPDYSSFADKPWPEAEKRKAAMITLLDRDIGRLVAKIKELGIEKNTIVIFSSDNGPHKEGGIDPEILDSNGNLRGTKRDLYEGGIRVPLIAWWPETIKENTISDHISSFWDFLPTACDIAGISSPVITDGISYYPELTGKRQQKHEYLYWEFSELGGKQAVLKGKWKGVRNNLAGNVEKKLELYDLSKDLSESIDIAIQYPEVVDSLNAIIDEAHVKSKLFPLPGEN